MKWLKRLINGPELEIKTKTMTDEQKQRQRELGDPFSITHAWEISISIPKDDARHGWRKNRHLTVYANKAEDAIELVREEYSNCAIWSIQHRGQRSSKGSMIWERTYH